MIEAGHAKASISPAQLVLTAVGSAIMFPYTFLPVLRTTPHNQDAWLVTILMLFYILILNAPILFLMNKFRNRTINETAEIILGKPAGKVLSFVFIFEFLFCFTACMLIGMLFMNQYLFPDTPSWALLLYTIVPVIYAAYKGAGTVSRLGMLIAPFVLLTIIIFFLLGIDKMDIEALRPVFADSDLLQLNLGAFLTATRYSEVLIFLVFSHDLVKKASINKTYISALLIYAIAILLIVLPVLLTLGSEFAKHTLNPYFIFTRQVDIYDFIKRVQSINVFAWYTGLFFKLSLYGYMASHTLAGVFNAKSHKNFVIPIAVIAFIVCMLPFVNKSSTMEMLRSDTVFPFIVLPATFLVPLILIIVYAVRRKKIGKILKRKDKKEMEENKETADNKELTENKEMAENA